MGSGGGRRSEEIKRGKKEGERERRWEKIEWDKEKEGYRESRIPQVHKLVHLAIRKFPTQSQNDPCPQS